MIYSPGNWRVPPLPRPGRTIPIPSDSLSSCFLLPVFTCLFDPQITSQLTLYSQLHFLYTFSKCCVLSVVGLFTSQRCFCGDVLVPSIIITATAGETTRLQRGRRRIVLDSSSKTVLDHSLPVPSSSRISLSVDLKSYSRLFVHHGAISTKEK